MSTAAIADPPPRNAPQSLDIHALLEPAAVDEDAPDVQLEETHISWVLLAGDYAYKLRRPVRMPFLDFTTRDARRDDCITEVALNRRWAPELYLDVVPVFGPLHAPSLTRRGPVIDFAVKMRRFSAAARLDRIAERGELDAALVDELARLLADMHMAAPRAQTQGEFGTPEAIAQEVRGNFEALQRCDRLRDATQLAHLRELSEERLADLDTVFRARLADGFVRECHGDLHLQNLALVDGRLLPFDGAEFAPAFRWVDVASDLAFLLMDLHFRGLAAHAWRLLNGYLSHTGDHGMLRVLRHYLAYRALVRAKVAAIRAAQLSARFEADASHSATRANDLIGLAEGFSNAPRSTPLVLMHGVSGAGKSWLAARLAPELGAVWLRSDVERARLFPDDDARYAVAATRATYDRLLELAELVIDCGFPVIVDATFQDIAERTRFADLARARGETPRFLDITAPREVLRTRVRERTARGDDPSQADEAVLQNQLAAAQGLTDAERACSLRVDTANSLDMDAIRTWIDSPVKGHTA